VQVIPSEIIGIGIINRIRKLNMKRMAFLLSLIVIGISIIFTSCDNKEDDNVKQKWEKILKGQLELYPEMQPQDIYKFVYQAIFGPAHLGAQKDKMVQYLKWEINSITKMPQNKLIERIHPEDKYIRIDLKKFKAKNGKIDLLGETLFLSCKKEADGIAELKEVLSIIKGLIKTNAINIKSNKFIEYINKLESLNFPVPHHSEEYTAQYKPAYRVVSLEKWEEFSTKMFINNFGNTNKD